VNAVSESALYPLRFEPIYQYRPWGGRRLRHLLSGPLPGGRPIAEVWLLSDRDAQQSRVADGPLAGNSLRHLLEEFPLPMLGSLSGHCARFPLLLKFLDVTGKLSVQVHPSDADKELLPAGDTGKTEAWVVLHAGPEAQIFAGLKGFTRIAALRQAIAAGTMAEELASFTPTAGDAVLIPAGTVHSLSDVVVFEVQQNSDVTFRLYDWEHVDPTTGQRRPLQVDQAMACIDLRQGAIGPVTARVEQTNPILRERLVQCEQFGVLRVRGETPFSVGAQGIPRVLVCLDGSGQLENAEGEYPFHKGEVILLPAVVGTCLCRPQGPTCMLEISLPQIS
jgi:mannose-6-phosphate isomerase